MSIRQSNDIMPTLFLLVSLINRVAQLLSYWILRRSSQFDSHPGQIQIIVPGSLPG